MSQINGAGDPFTRDKLQWLDRIAIERRVSAEAFRLAYVIASRFLSRERGYAFPRQQVLADLVNVGPRQVRKLIAELTVAGYLDVARMGKKMPNEYRIVIGTDSSAPWIGTDSSAPYQPSEQPYESRRAGRPSDPALRRSSTFKVGQSSTLDDYGNNDDARSPLTGLASSDRQHRDQIIGAQPSASQPAYDDLDDTVPF